ncbi:MAG TPA: hypothetical protein VF384_01625 [Planctomycetota bacterium]
MSEPATSVAAPVPPVRAVFAPRERRILLWLTVAAVSWRWLCAVQLPLPSVAACRDLWLAQRLANGEFAPLAEVLAQPWWALLLWPPVAAGCDAFTAAQVLACIAGGLLVWPVALAAEKLRQGAGLPAAVLALGAGGPAAAAASGAVTPLLELAVAMAVVGIVARRPVLAAVAGAVALAPGLEAIATGALFRTAPWQWHELRLGWGTSAALALLCVLPPRPRCLPVLGSFAAAMFATAAVRGGLQWLLISSPVVIVLAGTGLARLPVRLRDVALCAAVLAEGWIGWQALEPRTAIVERALGEHLQGLLTEGLEVVSDLPRVLLFAGSEPTALRDADALLAGAAGDKVQFVVLGRALARQTTVTAALASRFAHFELQHDLGDLVAERKLAVFVRR